MTQPLDPKLNIFLFRVKFHDIHLELKATTKDDAEIKVKELLYGHTKDSVIKQLVDTCEITELDPSLYKKK